jgi:hypothetical protein
VSVVALLDPLLVTSPVRAGIVVTVAALEDVICVHDPGLPNAVQTQTLAVWSITKSPTAKVPVVGAPEVVAPTYLEAAIAPVSPLAIIAGADRLPVKVCVVAEDLSAALVT